MSQLTVGGRRHADPVSYTHRMRFLERLGRGTVVFDGAMGTMLYGRGVFVNRCFDELNLSSPNLVRQVHAEYLEAGAEVIETNTFGAHRFKLGPARPRGPGPEDQPGGRAPRPGGGGRRRASSRAPSDRSASRSSRSAASRRRTREAAYREQAEGLLEGGVDLFLLETMPSLDQAKAALQAVRSLTSELPVAVSLTFNEEGHTLYGDSPEDVVRELEALGVPLDRRQLQPGPAGDARDASRMAAVARTAKLSAMPNAGSPAYVDGRYVYLCTPEYMATWARRFLQAGASVVGGCCGTTPAHIRDLVRSVRMFQPGREVEAKVVTPPRRKEAPAPVPREEKSALARSLRPQVRGLGGARPAARRRGGRPDRARAVLQGERGRRDQRRRRPARLGAHERPGAVRAAAGEGGDRHDPALHLPRPEPARDPVRPAGRPRAGAPERARDHRRPAQARRLPGRDRGLRRGLDRPHPHHGQPQPRRRPRGQPDGPRARDPRRLRRRPEQARHRQGSPAPRGEGEGAAPSTS